MSLKEFERYREGRRSYDTNNDTKLDGARSTGHNLLISLAALGYRRTGLIVRYPPLSQKHSRQCGAEFKTAIPTKAMAQVERKSSQSSVIHGKRDLHEGTEATSGKVTAAS